MDELRNCEFCGRDTKNKSGACRHCMRGVNKHTKHEREHELSEAEKDMFREVNGVSRDTQVLRDVYRSVLDEIE